MKIRNVLKLAAVVPLALTVVVVAVYFAAASRLREARSRADLADRATAGVFELTMLTYEYVAAPSERLRQQWRDRHGSIGALLDQLAADEPEQAEVLAAMRDDHRGIGEVFSQLTEALEPSTGDPSSGPLAERRTERLVGELLQRSQDMISSAQTIGNRSRVELLDIQRLAGYLVLVLIAVFALAFLATLLVVGRKTGRPLAALYDAVKAVGSENFDVEIPAGGNDEIGNVCRAFNASTQSLKRCRAAVEGEMADRRRAEERVRHLNDLLKTIRNVNQLIAREKDREQLLQSVCDALVEVRGCDHAWVVLLDEKRKLTAAAEAGLGEPFHAVVGQLRRGQLCGCIRRALAEPGVVVAEKQSSDCSTCALLNRHVRGRPMAMRLQYGDEVFGVMSVTLPEGFASEEEHQDLLQEAAGDVAFALHGMRLESQRKEAEEALRLNESRLDALWRLGQMTDASLKEITDFALEEAVRLTKSQIGYLAFMNEDETVLTMHSWSKNAMEECAVIDKPIVYPVETTGLWGEAARQRKPVITNDYTAPSDLKKGLPVGHVGISSHMNVPIFDGRRIVVVAGVGNKAEPYDDSDVRQLTLLMEGMWRLLERRRAEEALQKAHDELEQRVKERTAELDQANEELRREIAERKIAEEVIRDSEALYSSLVENLPVYVLRKDADGRFVFASRSFCELLGKPPEEIVGKTDFDLYPAELARKYHRDDLRVMETGKLLSTVEENRQDGEVRHVEVRKSAVRDASGEIVGVQVVFWDVTERKQAEAALEQERYLLHSLMDHLPHNIYFKDDQSRFIRINKALSTCFGLNDASEAMGKTDFDFFTDEHARQAMADEEEILRTGRPLIDKEEKETWTDGSTTWALTTKMPLYDEESRVVGTFGISRDITEQKRAAEALREAKEAAEAASRAKSDFLANMSHEIRTPMNAIIGMTELVLDTDLNESQRDYLKMVRDSGDALLGVINDILDFSKIEAGKLELASAPFSLRESLGDTMKSLALRAHGKKLELAFHFSPDVPDQLVGDVGRLRQIVVNLVGNAIKFTDQGEVILDAGLESRTADEVVLRFTVSDTGIGIPKEKCLAIFEAFEQADSSTTRRFGGTGLGLAISARLVDCMDGRIWVESEVGRGSRFHFTARFPLAEEQVAELLEQKPVILAGTRVLVVDDNATNRLILEEILRNWGMEPTLVDGAPQALVLLEGAHRDSQPFALVLTDANMPEMDGFSLAEKIKSDSRLSGTIIMMLTSGDRPADVARCEQLGLAAYLLKPIKQSELFNAVATALGISAVEDVGMEPHAETRPVELPPLRILLAEDSLVNQKLAVGLLQKHGHEVVVVNDGKEALAAIEKDRFDLVLMDVQMPEMDGFEATRTVREAEKQTGAHLPIVAMTAHAMKGDREQCLAVGMDSYVAKPVRARQLFETIKEVLDSRDPRTRSQADRAEEAAVDWNEALQGVEGDRELLESMVEAFLEESPSLAAAMCRAIADSQPEELRVAAHTLKGSLRFFGARDALAAVMQLESMGRDGNLKGAEATLAQLEDDLQRVVAELQTSPKGAVPEGEA